MARDDFMHRMSQDFLPNECIGYGQHAGKCTGQAAREGLCRDCEEMKRRAGARKFDSIGSAMRPGGPGRRTRLKIEGRA